MISNNSIYTVIHNAVLALDATANVTQTYSPIPAKFPTVFVREIGRFTPPTSQTITNSQDVYESTWEVQIFSNLTSGAKEQAYSLMQTVKDEFRGMYFIETMEHPVDSEKNKYYTLVARFRRIIWSGNTI